MTERISNPHTLRFDPAYVDHPVECWRVEWVSPEGYGEFTRSCDFDTQVEAETYAATVPHKSRIIPFVDWQPRMTEERFAAAVAAERDAGLAFVDRKLDRLCERWGLDPVDAWRQPREREQRWRHDQVTFRTAWRYALAQPLDVSVFKGTGA